MSKTIQLCGNGGFPPVATRGPNHAYGEDRPSLSQSQGLGNTLRARLGGPVHKGERRHQGLYKLQGFEGLPFEFIVMPSIFVRTMLKVASPTLNI